MSKARRTIRRSRLRKPSPRKPTPRSPKPKSPSPKSPKSRSSRKRKARRTKNRAQVERVPESLKPRVAGLLRLARKAGRIVIGIALTRECVREGRARAVWIADDLSDRRGEVLLDRWCSSGVVIYGGWTKDELGDLAGKAAVAVLSVTDPNIAAGVSQIVKAAMSSEQERRGGEQG